MSLSSYSLWIHVVEGSGMLTQPTGKSRVGVGGGKLGSNPLYCLCYITGCRAAACCVGYLCNNSKIMSRRAW